MTQTLDQRRAADSLKKVREIRKRLSGKKADSYADYTIRLPASILINGLGQAVAQLQAAAGMDREDPHLLLYKDLSDWLCRNEKEAPYPEAKDLLEGIVSKDRSFYLRAQAEALAWLEWHKKLVTAYLKKTERESS